MSHDHLPILLRAMVVRPFTFLCDDYLAGPAKTIGNEKVLLLAPSFEVHQQRLWHFFACRTSTRNFCQCASVRPGPLAIDSELARTDQDYRRTCQTLTSAFPSE